MNKQPGDLWIPLSETDEGDALTSVATYATKTTLHTVPDDEVHAVYLVFMNSNNGADVELLGDIGDSSDVLNLAVPQNGGKVEIGPIVLGGGKSIAVGAIANGGSIKTTGGAIVRKK